MWRWRATWVTTRAVPQTLGGSTRGVFLPKKKVLKTCALRKVFCAWRLNIELGHPFRRVHVGDLVKLVAARPAIPVGYVRLPIGCTLNILMKRIVAQVAVGRKAHAPVPQRWITGTVSAGENMMEHGSGSPH